MSDRYPGGLIRKTPPTITPPTGGEGGSASGIWTMDQVAYYIKEGTWPKPVLPRELYTWGDNGFGELGQNDRIPSSSPVQVGSLSWDYVGAGFYNVAAISGGKLFTWGNNSAGMLGLNDVIPRSSPVQVGALTNWQKAVGFAGNGMVALKTDGTIWSWGSGSSGMLGLGDSGINRSSPVQIGSLTDWADVAAGSYVGLALKTDGTLWVWGYNVYGALGTNTTINYSSPVQVGALTNWLKLEGGTYFSGAVKTDGTLWTWGDNKDGCLGLNASGVLKASSPVQVGALTTWLNLAAGRYAMYGIKTDNTLWAWGDNTYGQLGQNDIINRSSPTQVGEADWSTLSTETFVTMFGIKTNGTLWGWGLNSGGRLGDGSIISKSSPVQIGSETTWASVSANANHATGLLKVVS